MKTLICVLVLLVAPPAWAQILPPTPQVVSVQDSGTACSVANTCATWTMNGAPSVTMQLVGTCNSCIGTFEATANGSTWVAINVLNLGTGTVATTTTVAGQFIVLNTGLLAVRVRAGTLSSGAWNVTLTRGTATGSSPLLSELISDGTNTQLVNPCASVAPTVVAISQTGSTKLVSAVAAKKNYICSILIVAATAEIVNLIEGTGSTCGSTQAALVGSTTAANGLSFAANGGFAQGDGNAAVITGTGTALDLCLTQNSTARIAGFVTYVQR